VAKKTLENINPQSYGLGIKELWEVQPGKIKPGFVAHTLGWPLSTKMYGGGWIYGLSNDRVSVGLVVALEYADPRFDPHAAFQIWKTHPFVCELLAGGKMVRYGAKSLPYGGWYAMPRSYVDGGLIVGDSGGLLDSQRLKGVHLAMKSGMLAAETIFEALKAGDTSATTLKLYQEKIEHSYIKDELWKVRNFHQSSITGCSWGCCYLVCRRSPDGRGLVDPMRTRPGHEAYTQIHGGPAPEALQRGWQVDVRPPDGCLSLRDAARRRPALPLESAGSEYLLDALRVRVWQPVSIFLPGGGL
jgi:Dehydrogenases (flavoproteins)